jgi:phosphoglycerate dehydrogenase-like enzyme
VTLTNAPGLHTVPIAESVLAAMLDHAKRLRRRRIDQKNREWNRLENDELAERTVLILGLGRIGKRVAQLCRAFGMRVVGTKRNVEDVSDVEKVFSLADLNEYLPRADFLVLALPLTDETEHVLCEEQFSLMKQTAYLINVGRGKSVDEQAMLTALSKKTISGAYLDAFAEEPLPENHPLWDMENVLLVPHDSHSSPFIGDRMVEIFCSNLQRYVKGEPLKNVCDPKKGY